MFEIMTDEASKIYKKTNSETERSEIMDKYALIRRCHHYRQIQVYM